MKSLNKPQKNGKISNLLLNKKSKIGSLDIKRPKPILLIDSSVLVYQSFYAMGHLSYGGKETGVIYGFLKNILSLATRFNTNHFIFCWDSKFSHRRDIYPDYKKERRAKREDALGEQIAYKSLLKQKQELEQSILPALGFNNSFLMKGYEGDDLLAYWALRLKTRSIIITTDADMYQCLNNCDIWNPRKKVLFTKTHLLKEFGIDPSRWALAKAIGGCSGDGVMGIEGVSDPKNSTSKALKYIQGKLSKGVILNKIQNKEGQAIIKRNLPLVTVPYKHNDISLSRIILRRNMFDREKFLQIFDQLHFASFLKEDYFKKWAQAFLERKKMKLKKQIDKKTPPIATLLEYLGEKIADLSINATKFDKGNTAAGVRTRVKLQKIAYDIKEVRYEILLRKKKREEAKAKKNA